MTRALVFVMLFYVLSSDVVSNPVRSIVISFHPDWFRYFSCFLFDIFVTILTMIHISYTWIFLSYIWWFFCDEPKSLTFEITWKVQILNFRTPTDFASFSSIHTVFNFYCFISIKNKIENASSLSAKSWNSSLYNNHFATHFNLVNTYTNAKVELLHHTI